MSGDKKQLSIKKLALNPGIIGVLAALLLFVCRVHLPDVIAQPVLHLANLNTPLPMLIIGFYLSGADFKRAFTDGRAYLAMLFRLAVIPLCVLFAMAPFGLNPKLVIAFVIASSAPTAATTTMFAAKFDRDVELSVSVVAASTLISIVTMPLVVSLAYTICPVL
jgi:predicted permease